MSSTEIEPSRATPLAEILDDYAGLLAVDVAQDHVARRPPGRGGEDDEVDERSKVSGPRSPLPSSRAA
jgi:hypothetical protein